MARWTGTWLSGLGAAGVSLRADDDWRGKRLGLPAAGAGSAASFNARLGALLVDLVVAALLRGLLRLGDGDPGRALWAAAGFAAFVLLYAVLLPTAAQTFGMRLAGIRVVRISGDRLSFPQALLRGLLVSLVVPALITDRDGRGLHDKAVGSVALRA